MNTAYIKALLKQGKDPTYVASYRLISLRNVDLKLIFKIMADRLALILPRLINTNQMGFIKGRLVSNIRKVLAILTIDAEKAFDNVNWGWLNMVLTPWGSFQGIPLLAIC